MPVNVGVDTVQIPEVLVWSVEAPIWYADADYVIEQLHAELDSGSYSVVVLDGAAISDLDYTGVLAMGTLLDHLVAEQIPVLIARATLPVQQALARTGMQENVTLHPTVSDAVKEGVELAGLEAEFRAARGKKKDLARLAEAAWTAESFSTTRRRPKLKRLRTPQRRSGLNGLLDHPATGCRPRRYEGGRQSPAPAPGTTLAEQS